MNTPKMFRDFQAGSEEAFSRLYSTFRKPILRYVSLRIPGGEAAEEVTQEIFLKVFRFRDRYCGKYAFSTWLWTIAKNTVADHLRGRREPLADADSSPEEIACERLCAETLIAHKDERRRLFRLARSLTRMQRRVLWFRVVEQLSFAEIAERLRLSVASVKNLAYRAKLSLGEELAMAVTVP